MIKIGMIWYLTSFAIFMHNQRKNPEFAMPSTMIIIPAMNTIVSQLIPAEASLASPAVCQNPGEKILSEEAYQEMVEKYRKELAKL